MEPRPPDDPPMPEATAEGLLDAFRAHPEWTEEQRDEQLDRLVALVPADRILAAVLPRLGDLGLSMGEAILRLVEAHATPEVLRQLAEALVAQPDLPPERSWEALALLDGAGLLGEYPELQARWDELDEILDERGSLDELAEQLEGDPEGTWLALQGLGAVEPEIRPEIIEGLSHLPLGPGLTEFLRLLCFAHDPGTRAAALAALACPAREAGAGVPTPPHVEAAWATIASDHPDADVAALARGWLGAKADSWAVALQSPERAAPRLVRCLVPALDGRGQGTIFLASLRGASRATAAFSCDVRRGVSHVWGELADDALRPDGLFERATAASTEDINVVEGVPELALRLLGGCVLLCGESTPPALRYWLEATIHPGFRPLPFPAPFPGWDPASIPMAEMPGRTRAVLDACPTWLDDSPLTREIAEEILLREGDASAPDPRRDAGAYRYLFEHRLLGQLELYRRMLYWMASFWQAAGAEELGHSALALAWQLSDAAHAVPGHPFTVELTTRSLLGVWSDLRPPANRPWLPPPPGA